MELILGVTREGFWEDAELIDQLFDLEDSGLLGQMHFLRYKHMEEKERWNTNVQATMIIQACGHPSAWFCRWIDPWCRNNFFWVGKEVVHITDGCTDGYSGLDLPQFLLRLTKEFLGIAVARGWFEFFGQGLQVRYEVEVQKLLLAPSGQLDGMHGPGVVVACGVLCIDQLVMLWEINLMVEEAIPGCWWTFIQCFHCDSGIVRAAFYSFAILSQT